jgi:hypothetical protein
MAPIDLLDLKPNVNFVDASNTLVTTPAAATTTMSVPETSPPPSSRTSKNIEETQSSPSNDAESNGDTFLLTTTYNLKSEKIYANRKFDNSSVLGNCSPNNDKPNGFHDNKNSFKLDEELNTNENNALLDEEDEDEDEISSSSISTSSLSPLSSFETRGNILNINGNMSDNENTEITSNDTDLLTQSNKNTELNETSIFNKNNDDDDDDVSNNKNNNKALESDDISYISDSLTPTPTPTAINSQDNKFTEFSNGPAVSHTPLPPPPNTLALLSNLNQTPNTPELTTPPPLPTTTTTTTSISSTTTISADTPEFIPASQITTPPQSHLAYIPAAATAAFANSGYPVYPTCSPSSYSYSLPSSSIMSPISDHNQSTSFVTSPESVFTNHHQAVTALTPTASSSTIYVHVDAGHIFQVHLGDKCKEIVGPATVKIVGNDSTQPFPLQLTSPAPGQLVQQILNENGMLTHLIISSQPQYNHQGAVVSSPIMSENSSSIPPYNPYQVQHQQIQTPSPFGIPVTQFDSSAVSTTIPPPPSHNIINNQDQYYQNQYPPLSNNSKFDENKENSRSPVNNATSTKSETSPNDLNEELSPPPPPTHPQTEDISSNNTAITRAATIIIDNTNSDSTSQISSSSSSSSESSSSVLSATVVQSISPSSLSSCSSTTSQQQQQQHIHHPQYYHHNQFINQLHHQEPYLIYENTHAQIEPLSNSSSINPKNRNRFLKINTHNTSNHYYNNNSYNIANGTKAPTISNNNNNRKFQATSPTSKSSKNIPLILNSNKIYNNTNKLPLYTSSYHQQQPAQTATTVYNFNNNRSLNNRSLQYPNPKFYKNNPKYYQQTQSSYSQYYSIPPNSDSFNSHHQNQHQHHHHHFEGNNHYNPHQHSLHDPYQTNFSKVVYNTNNSMDRRSDRIDYDVNSSDHLISTKAIIYNDDIQEDIEEDIEEEIEDESHKTMMAKQ